jgi:GST-like protein
MERQLTANEYIAGSEYSIADIALWSWVAGYGWSGVSVDGLPQLKRWIDLVGARPAVQKGRLTPPPADTSGDKARDTVESARKMLA